MSVHAEQTGNRSVDLLKVILAAAIIVGGFFAAFYYSEWNNAVKVLAVLFAMTVAAGVLWNTAQGRFIREYLVEARFELRKVVWPTRQETMQTTLVILVVVIILSIILWLVDMMLGWVILEHLFKSS